MGVVDCCFVCLCWFIYVIGYVTWMLLFAFVCVWYDVLGVIRLLVYDVILGVGYGVSVWFVVACFGCC